METAIVNTNGLGRIVLTDNGTVIGYITLETRTTTGITGEVKKRTDFTGRAVNVLYETNNGFGCGLAINADLEEVATAENFLEAIKVGA